MEACYKSQQKLSSHSSSSSSPSAIIMATMAGRGRRRDSCQEGAEVGLPDPDPDFWLL